jgi:GT2 family glycosyltransferase
LPTNEEFPRVAIVVVTYNQAERLAGLLQSIACMDRRPERVVVVDNASGDETGRILHTALKLFDHGQLVIKKLTRNVGEAGGFKAGIERALQLGMEWVWLTNDEVEFLPGALDRMRPWMVDFRCLHPRRYDFDGAPYFWQPRINERLGIPMPYSHSSFGKKGYILCNSGSFEGMLIHRDVINEIGFPDPRFFMIWDDITYGWLAAQAAPSAYVNVYALKRVRRRRHIKVMVRQINDSKPLVKYYMMRNRGYFARYLRAHGKLHRFSFWLGTRWTYIKELIRLMIVEHSWSGVSHLKRGLRDAKTVQQDRTWRPMPALTD